MNTVKIQNPGASAAAIQHHYDISNDFYHLWLDSTNTYSCALWLENDTNDTLELAQLRKIDFHINQARAKDTKRVLDVGCGWGSTLKRLVESHNVEHAMGLTLSKAQAEWIISSSQPKIEVKLESWIDHFPEEPYDAIISIGAFEHFASPDLSKTQKIEAYHTFFQHCHQFLKPGGWMSLQTIAYGNKPIHYGDADQFMINEVFPETWYPRLVEILEASEPLFEVVALRNDRRHYERTCRAWLSNLRANRTAAVNLVGEEMVKRYEKYLSISTIGFHIGTTNLLRITMHRIDDPVID